MLPWIYTCICKLHFPHFNSISLSTFMYTSPCTAPAPHSAPVLTSTDPHEPTAKQQTTEPSHCQSKCLVCLPIICVAKLLHKHEYIGMNLHAHACKIYKLTHLYNFHCINQCTLSCTLYSPCPPTYTNEEWVPPHGQAASNRVTTSS